MRVVIHPQMERLRALIQERFPGGNHSPGLDEVLGPMNMIDAFRTLADRVGFEAIKTWPRDKPLGEAARELADYIEENDLREEA